MDAIISQYPYIRGAILNQKEVNEQDYRQGPGEPSKRNPNTLLKCEDQVVISNCRIFDCGEVNVI